MFRQNALLSTKTFPDIINSRDFTWSNRKKSSIVQEVVQALMHMHMHMHI